MNGTSGSQKRFICARCLWHVHDCPASFDFAECHYRCRVAREAFALAGTEPYVSQETRRDTEVYE